MLRLDRQRRYDEWLGSLFTGMEEMGKRPRKRGRRPVKRG